MGYRVFEAILIFQILMFEYLPEVCREIHSQVLQIYWIMIIPFSVLLIIFEFLKCLKEIQTQVTSFEGPISMILIYSFNSHGHNQMVRWNYREKINGVKSLWELMGELGKNYEDNSVGWLKFQSGYFILSLVSYIVAYLGVFVANVLIHLFEQFIRLFAIDDSHVYFTHHLICYI